MARTIVANITDKVDIVLVMLKQNIRQLVKRIYKKPALLERSSLIIILIFNLVVQFTAYYTLDYTSDSMSQQVLLNKWVKYGMSGTWFGPDPLLVKMPLHWVVELFFGQSIFAILVATTLFTTVMICCIFYSLRFFMYLMYAKQLKRYPYVFPLMFLLPISIYSYAMTTSLTNGNLRSIELGIWFIALAAFAKFRAKTIQSKKSYVYLLLWSILGGALIFNDTAMLFLSLLPLLLLLAWQFIRYSPKGLELRRIGLLTASLIGSLVFYEVWKKSFEHFGVHFYTSSITFIDYGTIGYNISTGLHNFISLLGADVFGQPLLHFATLVGLLNMTVMFAALGATVYFVIKGKGWLRFFAFQPILLLFIYIFSGLVSDVTSARYLVLIPFYFVVLLAALFFKLISRPGLQRMAYLLLVVVILCFTGNVFSYIREDYRAHGLYSNGAQERNYIALRVAQIAKQYHLTKGYAPTVYANSIDYLSKYEVNMSPLYCHGGDVKPLYLLITTSSLNAPSRNSFILTQESSASSIVTSAYPALNLPAGMDYSCPAATVEKYIGLPQHKIQITSDMSVFIYNHDILNKIDQQRTTSLSPIN